MASTTAQDENKNLIAIYQGILVEVISPDNGPTLPMFPDPDSETNKKPNTTSYYIEAKTGERFTVRVTITSEFQWYRCSVVKATVLMDGHYGMSAYLNQRDWLKEQKTTQCNFDSYRVYHPQSRVWREVLPTFGVLKLSMFYCLC